MIRGVARHLAAQRRPLARWSSTASKPSPAADATGEKNSEALLPVKPTPKPKWHEFTPTRLAVVNTVGNLCSLGAAASHDHMLLRLLAGLSSTAVFCFNAFMPKPLKTHQQTAAGWGFAFAILHFVNFGLLLREQHHGVQLSDEEEDIYEHGFQLHGVTPRQFVKLLHAGAKFVDYKPGQHIAEMDKPVDKVSYVVHGSCNAERLQDLTVLEFHQDVFIGKLHPMRYRAEYTGNGVKMKEYEDQSGENWEDEWLIESAEKSARRMRRKRPDVRKLLADGISEKVGHLTEIKAGSAWCSDIRAGADGCRVLEWPLGSFTCAVGSDEKLCSAMEQVDEMSLASKISAGSSRKALDGYKDLLELVILDGRIGPEEKHALHRYRTRHGVPDAAHFQMLSELGWSRAEFEDGILNSKWAAISSLWRKQHPELAKKTSQK